ncbi:NAC domain-containing protein 83-like [Lotus japonicus]|uniref:NAC domain-containing protein 83-like n=1 Tax=Lotus japonicus TaxID=34305 RepID=UPI0025848978|nr:NAC domain-containing protein 83-like [Lotus japonicus]
MGRDLESLDMRVAGSGQWRVVEKGKDVHIPRNNQVIGKRNTLIFWEVEGVCARRIKWVMHEFRLVLISNPSKNYQITRLCKLKMQIAKWSVYRIFQKKDAKKVKSARGSNGGSSKDGENNGSVRHENDNFLGPPHQ